MFHIIPISSELTISATPLGAKSIRHLYFENKNDGLFRFKTSPDTISISVDGKQICRDLLVLPFCTSSPYSPDRFPWQKVALEVNVNCNLSEIRIQSSALGDFNVIMVCSDEGVDESLGFDFFETKRITLRKSANLAVIRKALQEAFDKAALTATTTTTSQGGEGQTPTSTTTTTSLELTKEDTPRLWERYLNEQQGVEWPYTLSAGSVLARTAQYKKNGKLSMTPANACNLIVTFAKLFGLTYRAVYTDGNFPAMLIEGTPKASPDNLKYLSSNGSEVKIADSVSFSVRIDGAVYTTAEFCAEKNIEGNEVKKTQLVGMSVWVQQKALYNSDFFRQENIFRFDHSPKMMFVYNLTRLYSPKSADDDVWLHCDYPLTFTLSGAGREITEPDTDLELYTANDRIPMRDALLLFNEEDGVTRSISVNVNRRKTTRGVDITETKHPVRFTDWTLYFLFGYKKIV